MKSFQCDHDFVDVFPLLYFLRCCTKLTPFILKAFLKSDTKYTDLESSSVSHMYD